LQSGTTYRQSQLPIWGTAPLPPPTVPLTGPVLQPPQPTLVEDQLHNNNNNLNNNSVSIFPSDSTFGDPLPRLKADGHIWIGFCNIDGFPATSFQNPKVTKLCSFISQMDLDIFAGCESNINWSKMPKGTSLWEWFRSELPLRTISSHNIHDNFHRRQFGGTFLLGSGPITSSITASGVDPSGLGRWSWFRLQGRTGRSIRIISGYRPRKTEKARLQTVYSQHQRHLESLGDYTCPCAAFLRDLSASLTPWQAAGDSIIFMADVNGDIRKPSWAAFCQTHSLREAVISAHPHLPTLATFKKGSHHGVSPIDGIWVSQDLPVALSSWSSFQLSPGDHRAGIIDIDLSALIGKPCQKVICPKACCLTCSIPASCDAYNQILLDKLQWHSILSKLHALFTKSASPGFDWNTLGPRLEALDSIKSQCMQHAEKKCHKL